MTIADVLFDARQDIESYEQGGISDQAVENTKIVMDVCQAYLDISPFGNGLRLRETIRDALSRLDVSELRQFLTMCRSR